MEIGFEKLREVKFDFTWGSVRAMADLWEVVIALVIIMLLLNLIGGKKRWAAGSFFAVLLLVGRKVAFYIPVVGTMSSADRVVFWSVGAFIYFALLAASFSCAVFIIKFYGFAKIKKRADEIIATAIYFPIGALIGSGVFLPVDGWCHLYMPIISLLSLVKVLFVSPLLLPVACLTLVMHSFFILFGQRAVVREINKLAVILLLIGGGVQFAYQIVNFAISPIISDIRESWTTQQLSGDSSPREETSDFLDLWAENIGEIHRSGINLIGKSPDQPSKPSRAGNTASVLPTRAEILQDTLLKLPDPWRLARRRFEFFIPLVSAGILFFLMVSVERLRLGDEQELFAEDA